MNNTEKKFPPFIHSLNIKLLLFCPVSYILILYAYYFIKVDINSLFQSLYLPSYIIFMIIFLPLMSLGVILATFFLLIQKARKLMEPLKILNFDLVIIVNGGILISTIGLIIGIICIAESHIYWWILSFPYIIAGIILTLYLYSFQYQRLVKRAKEIYFSNSQ